MAAVPLRPQWTSRGARVLAVGAVIAAVLALALRMPFGLDEIDDVALRIGLPASLAFVLAFAPQPVTEVGRLARVLTVLGLAASVFAGDGQPLLLACYPLVLMSSVLVVWLRDRRQAGAGRHDG